MSFLNTLVLSYVWKAKVAVKSESNVCSFNHDLKKKNVNHVHRLRCCLFNVHALKWSAAGHTARMRSCDLISWYMLKCVLVCSGGRAADRHTSVMESLEGLPTWPTQWGKQNSSAAPPETSVELQRVPSPYLKKIKRENVRRGSLWCCLPLHEDLVYCRLVPLDRSHNEIPARTTESRRPRSSLSCEEKMEEWEEVVPRRTEKKTTQTKRVIKVRHRNVFKPPGCCGRICRQGRLVFVKLVSSSRCLFFTWDLFRHRKMCQENGRQSRRIISVFMENESLLRCGWTWTTFNLFCTFKCYHCINSLTHEIITVTNSFIRGWHRGSKNRVLTSDLRLGGGGIEPWTFWLAGQM